MAPVKIVKLDGIVENTHGVFEGGVEYHFNLKEEDEEFYRFFEEQDNGDKVTIEVLKEQFHLEDYTEN